MVSPVVVALRGALQADSSSMSSRRVARLAKLLYWLTKVRGSKTIGSSPSVVMHAHCADSQHDHTHSPLFPARCHRLVLLAGPPFQPFRSAVDNSCRGGRPNRADFDIVGTPLLPSLVVVRLHTVAVLFSTTRTGRRRQDPARRTAVAADKRQRKRCCCSSGRALLLT